jgi:hypothetical protein
MKRFGIILLGILIAGFFMVPGSAVAHTSHTDIRAESPFDAPKVKKSLHCMLQGHQHSATPFCPHTMRERSAQTQFKADCGDHPSGTPVQTSWSKTFLILKAIAKVSPDRKITVITSTQFLQPSLIQDSLDKPPQ